MLLSPQLVIYIKLLNFIVMYTNEQIKATLKNIFVDTTGYNPFETSDSFYHRNIKIRFLLDELDIIELVVKMEMEFRINISGHETEKIGCMNIEALVNFISSKCS